MQPLSAVAAASVAGVTSRVAPQARTSWIPADPAPAAPGEVAVQADGSSSKRASAAVLIQARLRLALWETGCQGRPAIRPAPPPPIRTAAPAGQARAHTT